VDAINVGFDECKSFQGYCTPLLFSPITVTNRPAISIAEDNTEVFTKTTVNAYPNPFTDKVRFEIKSPVSGQAVLEMYNTMGQKVQTVYKGFVFANKSETVEYNIPSLQRTNLFYILRIGDKQISGKLIYAGN